ncbi:ribonuclease H-like protein [Aureobasidium sp. EXF-12298]|nr:ribonuclease H-like protein [Aureobasidium sp. EXF-12298]
MTKADPVAFLSTLRAWQLKHLAFLTGLNSTDCTKKPTFPSPRCRILSIDMGVKNLAFCLLDLHKLPRDSEQTNAQAGDRMLSLHLADWKRLDVSERLAARHTNPPITTTSRISEDRVGKAEELESIETTSEEGSNLYAPSSLSKIAFGLASEFLRYKPDYILIERQRFRSGGGPAIQEWTVRVNMLESMLWASLETMRHSHHGTQDAEEGQFPDVLEMSPRRVGMFWLTRGDFFPAPVDIAASLMGSQDTAKMMETDIKKKSFEKKDKIALARHWLSLALTTDELTVDADLARMVASFCSPKERQSRRRSKDEEHGQEVGSKDASAISGKLDDLADCLVQAVTFALWEQNRARLGAYIDSELTDQML